MLLLACAVPVVLAFSHRRSPPPSSDTNNGRRRFLKTAAIGGAVVGAAVYGISSKCSVQHPIVLHLNHFKIKS